MRITLPTGSKPGRFILEGRLTGLWAQELLRVVRQSGVVQGSLIDLQEAFPVDTAGEEALRILHSSGASFIAESAYHKDLCYRLKLRRVGIADSESGGVKMGAATHKPVRLPKAGASGPDVLPRGDARPHPSENGE